MARSFLRAQCLTVCVLLLRIAKQLRLVQRLQRIFVPVYYQKLLKTIILQSAVYPESIVGFLANFIHSALLLCTVHIHFLDSFPLYTFILCNWAAIHFAYTYAYTRMYVHMYVFMYVCMCIHACLHVYQFRAPFSIGVLESSIVGSVWMRSCMARAMDMYKSQVWISSTQISSSRYRSLLSVWIVHPSIACLLIHLLARQAAWAQSDHALWHSLRVAASQKCCGKGQQVCIWGWFSMCTYLRTVLIHLLSYIQYIQSSHQKCKYIQELYIHMYIYIYMYILFSASQKRGVTSCLDIKNDSWPVC